MRWGRAGPRAFFLGHSTSLVGLSEDSPAVPTGDGLDSEEEHKEEGDVGQERGARDKQAIRVQDPICR